MYLHDNRELFREIIVSTAEELGIVIPIVEKDYYVTQILKQLAEERPESVFKGGTSLSKCHHAIERFSEDVDIAFSNQLTQGMRKHLKNDVIAGIARRLGMPILDWENARSRRDYNCYTFSYEPIEDYVAEGRLIQGVKVEVSLASTAFPTVQLPVDSYVYQFLSRDNRDIIEEFHLQPFNMNVQGIDRTLADKVFALCDYYMQGKTKRYSRHIYDIYMILPKVTQNEEFKQLVHQVRVLRSNMSICPSAVEGVSIPELLTEIIGKEVYKADYHEITTYFQNHPVDYDEAISALKDIANSGMFEN